MPDDDQLTATLAGWRETEQAATAGPWWFDESDQCWRLHGVAFKIPPQLFADGEVLIPEQVMNKQILKAPKCGTPYAEYWPDEADAAFIATARTAMPRLLAAVDAVLKLTRDSAGTDRHHARVLTVGEVREAITRELTKGEGDGNGS